MKRPFKNIFFLSSTIGLLVMIMNACGGEFHHLDLASLDSGYPSVGRSADSPYQCRSMPKLSEIAASDTQRLSVRQYKNTLTDLLTIAVGANSARDIVNRNLNQVDLPQDVGANFSRENNVFGGQHAQAYFDLADSLATELSSSHRNSIIQNFINLNPGSCTSINPTNLSNVCRDTFIRNFVERAFRRPIREASHNLTTKSGTVVDELSSLASELGNGSGNRLSQLLFRVFISPHFLFIIEDQDLAQSHLPNDDIYKLSSYAIASRLSYRFWNTMPDQELLEMARRSDLSQDTAYLEAVNHVLSRADKLSDSTKEYFHDWLRLDRTPQFTSNPRFNLLADGITFDSNLRSAMISEIEELGSYVVTSGGTFKDLFMTDVSVARHPSLVSLYDLNQSAPTQITDDNAVRFPSGERAGLLTRAALLVSGSENVNPIMRGFHVRKDILCLPLGAAPQNALDEFASIDVPHDIPTRDKVAIKTSGPACISCHNHINPLGFAFSNYNALGAYIQQEPIFAVDNNVIETYVNVDSSVDLSFVFGKGTVARDAIEFSELVAEQASARACFTEKIASYSLGRAVDPSRDACALDQVFSTLGDNSSLKATLRSIALAPEFRYRRIEE